MAAVIHDVAWVSIHCGYIKTAGYPVCFAAQAKYILYFKRMPGMSCQSTCVIQLPNV